jgi:hypothetical protein
MAKIFAEIPRISFLRNYDHILHVDAEYECVARIANVGVPVLFAEQHPLDAQFFKSNEAAIVLPRVPTRRDFVNWQWGLVPFLPVAPDRVLIVTDCWSDYERCDCFGLDETQSDPIALSAPFDRLLFDAAQKGCGDIGSCPLGNEDVHRIFAPRFAAVCAA